MAKFIPLADWLEQQYGDKAPGLNTARRWCRDGLIQPQPEKHGRCYFVDPNARYVAPGQTVRMVSGSLADRIREARNGAAAA